MTISIITLFPKSFDEFFSVSIIKRARENKKLILKFIDLRDFGIGKHKVVDDKPFGGGTGMVLRVDVMDKAIASAKTGKGREAVILLDPKGVKYNQSLAQEFSLYDHLILICGHYEGFDERIRDLVDYEVSIGDYVLSGGEPAAIVLIDSITRLIPGVLVKSEATALESFMKDGTGQILEHPHYTRPRVFKSQKVPEILLSGNFEKIEEYRNTEAKKITLKRRPDLA